MIPAASFITCGITLVISLILPVLILILFAGKHRKQGIVSAWLLGAAGFLVTQMLIRIPILNFLSTQSWFLAFSQNHLFLYSLSLAFTAGLFELAGRFATAKALQKKLTYNRALAAGLGHGGIEAMVLIGMTYVNNLTYMVMIQNGTFEAVIAQTAAMGVDVSQLYAIQEALLSTSPALFLLAGFERLLAMISHTAMSMIVCYGVHTGNTWKGLLLCLGIHTFLDLTAGISLILPQHIAYVIIYAILTAVAAASLLILKNIRTKWPKEVPYDPEK